MDEFRLKDRFEPGKQDVMHHPVPEISGEYLPQFRLFRNKADRAGRDVGALSKGQPQLEEIVKQAILEPQGIDEIPLSSPAREVNLVQAFEVNTDYHFPPRTHRTE